MRDVALKNTSSTPLADEKMGAMACDQEVKTLTFLVSTIE